MADLIHDFIFASARAMPQRAALVYRDATLSYADLAQQVSGVAQVLGDLGLARGERVGVYLEKRFETVLGLFGAAAAGGVFVPINPLLKPEQVAYILQDCGVRILITSAERLSTLAEVLPCCHDLHTVLAVGNSSVQLSAQQMITWPSMLAAPHKAARATRAIDSDVAAILYTSGSTGKPKGVVLSHRNMVAGARSVAEYLANHADDRLLSVLPLSFDYGLSQLTTAFHVGASAVLMNYLLPRDILKALVKYEITGLAAVPPLWIQLAQLEWPASGEQSVRYFTNSGGAMPRATLQALRARMPQAKPYLMYGLTEAFRSTYLPPEEVDRRPDSMGRAIPNAEIMVVRPDGSPCAPGELGELVHRGALVSLGYWNDADKTAERFKPVPQRQPGLMLPEIAVWSGDTVRMDEEGFLYFISRRDEMIKTSGYRVSPTEIEEVVYSTGLVGETAALGIPHPVLGQAIVLVASPRDGVELSAQTLLDACKLALPAFMLPAAIKLRDASLPRNPNGKIDRKALAQELQNEFVSPS